ncbi:hypothetical protein [Cohnella silvisoli]|uniref:Uncharacterized protein n=1 Tax=Cohnella silvisoli TaxID=2873699 RepID=A0ABV1L1I7_9BACL|nr:hypothetical protein [Cohnella silvisoli]MCD9025480.1 hypothetical protein [Cohnella silvisoli]
MGKKYLDGRSETQFTIPAKDHGIVLRRGSEELDCYGIARTKDLDGQWAVDPEPLFPLEEQIENSTVFYEEETGTWFLFTNHVGLNEIKLIHRCHMGLLD